MLILVASLAMVVDDILAVLLVQSESRNRPVMAGVLDSIMWLASMIVTVTTVTTMQSHHTSTKVLVVCAITLANFTGSLVGVQIGKRIIKER